MLLESELIQTLRSEDCEVIAEDPKIVISTSDFVRVKRVFQQNEMPFAERAKEAGSTELFWTVQDVDYFGKPFCVSKKIKLECAKKIMLKPISSGKNSVQSGESGKKSTFKMLRCPAEMNITEVVMYPEYGVDSDIKNNVDDLKKMKMIELRKNLEARVPVKIEKRYFISVSRPSHHNQLTHSAKIPTPPSLLKCDECGLHLNYPSSLRKHIKTFHPAAKRVSSVFSKMVCGFCKESFFRHDQLESHLKEQHDVLTEHERVSFSSRGEFDIWLASVEKRNNTMFVRQTSKRRSGKRIYFRCYQSGRKRSSVSEKTRKKKPKKFVCPARIAVFILPNGAFEVDHCKTHAFHTEELSSSGDIPYQLRVLRSRHKAAVRNMSKDRTWSAQREGNGWIVTSSQICERYLVLKELNDSCCSFVCTPCNSCVHQYTCTCRYSSLNSHMCEHIHIAIQLTQVSAGVEAVRYVLTADDISSDHVDYGMPDEEVRDVLHLEDGAEECLEDMKRRAISQVTSVINSIETKEGLMTFMAAVTPAIINKSVC